MVALFASLRGIFSNLRAGARVALFAPVQRQNFRVEAAQLLLFFIVSALVDNAADWIRAGPGAVFEWAGFGAEFAAFAVLLAAAALLAWAFDDGALVVALPIVVLASLPLVQITNLLTYYVAAREDLQGWIADAVYYLVLAWFLAVLWRSAFVALQPGSRRAVRAFAAAVLLAFPLFIPEGVLPEASWWRQAAEPSSLDASNPASEPVLALQRELQEEALGALDDHTQGEADLYFVAFAPDGAPGWRSQLARARKTMDEHWGTQRRSLVYLNDRATLTDSPIASVSHLREALEEIGSAIEPDEDIVMIYLAGRSNADGSLSVSLPPLALVPLTGAGLSHLLTQAGIRWRVIVLATCAPQPFVDALADDQTLIIAASPKSCDNGQGLPKLGDALFGDTLLTPTSLPGAFEAVRRKLESQGASPQVHVGATIGAQLARLRGAGGSRATFRAGTPGT